MKGAQMGSEDVIKVALDALTAALEAPSKPDAIFDARSVLTGLDDEALRRVAACLAVEAVYRPGVDRHGLDRWLGRMRLELMWSGSESSEVDG